MTPLVGILVAIAALVNIAAVVVLLAGLRRRPGETAGTGETTGHVWDEDLRELNNPLPRWWMWLFVLTVLFAAGYLAAYPGLRSAPGSLKWTSVGQPQDEQAKARAVTAPLFASFAATPVPQLAGNPQAMAVGE